MLVSLLFCENNKTAKLKDANTDTIPILISIDVEKVRLTRH